MKIVVIELAGQGGMAHYAFQLCRGLSNAGADVTLITRNDYELAMLCAPFRVEQSIRSMHPRRGAFSRIGYRLRYFREWRRILHRIKALRPDVVLLGQLRSAADYWPLIQLRRHTRVLASICHHPGAKDGFLWKRIYALFARVFVHFPRNRTTFHKTFGVPEKKVGVIVHGNEEIFSELADPTFSADTLRKQLGIGADEKIVLFFGNFAQYKGIDVLLRAFPDIHARTGARLVIAGHPTTGFDLEHHLALSESLGIPGAVVWVPEYIPSEHVVAWMQLPNVIVFPYREISHGGAVHVAQTYGVPTVASSVGAMQDVIDHDVTGLLVPPEDVEALSAAITRLLEDEPLAKRLGTQFGADARGRFSWDEIGKGILRELGG
ncbi:MAG TPA: glycosyltransferase family 4 protein [Thermoanaerobaculia bacterium]